MFLEYCADGDLKDYMIKKEEKRLSEVIQYILLYFSWKQEYSSNISWKDSKDSISQKSYIVILSLPTFYYIKVLLRSLTLDSLELWILK